MDPKLTEQLIEDAQGADALPLLAFTLERLLLDYGSDGDLLISEYRELGGISGSIEAAIDAAFANPGAEPAIPADRNQRNLLLRQGFLPWLARIEPDTDERKRRVARREEIPAESRPLMERLIKQRLLVRDRRRLDDGEEAVVVEVAHEALLRQWPLLSGWLDEDADALKAIEAAKQAANQWNRNNRNPAWLVHRGERRRGVEELLQRVDLDRLLGDEGRGYVRACRKQDDEAAAAAAAREREARAKEQQAMEAEKKRAQAEKERAEAEAKRAAEQARAAEKEQQAMEAEKRRAEAEREQAKIAEKRATDREEAERDRAEATRKRFRLMTVFAVIAILLMVIAAWMAWRSIQQEQIAEQLLANNYWASGVGTERENDPITAAHFYARATRGYSDATDIQAGRLKLQALQTTRNAIALDSVMGHDGKVLGAAFSADESRILTWSADKTARLWRSDGAAQDVTELARMGHDGIVLGAAFSADESRILTWSDDKTARLWDFGVDGFPPGAPSLAGGGYHRDGHGSSG
uniref:WD domain, G-beta repeat n=1 Tax=Candidatus Kentrum sp. TUN TaxID=2126343 RepID=A0A450ZZM2_9GAMM|nr:MAG: WD domain, G-beta repeat [Candidatus Kentron sp. TUN]